MKENIMPPLPLPVSFEELVKMVATTHPKELEEYKKQQKEKNKSDNSKQRLRV